MSESSLDRSEIEKALEAAVSEAPDARRALQVDMEKYQALLEDIDIPEDHKKQMIEALWSIVVAFVEIGYGVHPVQQACGKVNENKDKAVIAEQNDLYCDESSNKEIESADRPQETEAPVEVD